EIPEGGYVEIAATSKESMDKAVAMVNAIVELPEEGKVYTGTVQTVTDFGAFVQFMPNRDGLLHISEIGWTRYETMEQTGIKEGDTLEVKLIEVDKKTGKYRLSMRALQPKPEGYEEPKPRERGPRRDGDRRDNRGPRRDGDRGPRRDNRGPRPERKEE
ncbi:MAG: S1 RNA-binding domain-containing protein, partial [Muribaculaceae bacterium]|nr:S1 RNA-binding domain-containing protein [Muribaculaceae bacterium]